MIGSLLDWLDHRTGLKKLIGAMLLEGVPGGAKWRYVWGSCLAFVFSIQVVTGILLMTAYSPGDTQAWSSVHYIQYQMDFGWLVRGLHHFGSQTMMVLIALHMLQVVIAGAHLPPREVNWWLGIALLGVTFGLSLTGYLLPWDQKGYWATRVATNIPLVGDWLKQVIVGGPDYGNHTLTRFYALHVAILPLILVVLLIAHIVIFRRHGVTCKENIDGLVTSPDNEHKPGSEPFWPRQAFYDLLACLVVFGVMVALVLKGHGHPVETPADPDSPPPTAYEKFAHMGKEGAGANLDAPADRLTANYPARPEWYFLFLFQLLKYFEGDLVLVGTVHIPNGVMVLLMILPLLGYGRMRKFGHFVSVLVMLTLLGAIGMLTLLAMKDDSPEPIFFGLVKHQEKRDANGELDLKTEEGKQINKGIVNARKFVEDVAKADKLSARACQLAMAGVPVEGGTIMMRNDPMTKGRELFKMNCAGCHSYSGDQDSPWGTFNEGKFTAPDLAGFGKKPWIRDFLENPGHERFFGRTDLEGMKGWRDNLNEKRKAMDQAERDEQDRDLDKLSEWLADQANPVVKRDKALDKVGRELFADAKKTKNPRAFSCVKCHAFEGKGSETGPDLTGYGSEAWVRLMVMSPSSVLRHCDKNKMPAFLPNDGPGSDVQRTEFATRYGGTPIVELSNIDREMVLRWMFRDDRAVFGGATISGARKQ